MAEEAAAVAPTPPALSEKPDLLFRLQCFIFDLIQFRDDARVRIENSVRPYFMDEFYFADEEVEFLLDMPIQDEDGRKFRELLQEGLQARRGDGPICSSHSLAPLFWRSFGIRKDFHKSQEFKKKYKKFVTRRV